MPVYCYTTESGKTVERFYAMGKAPKAVKVDGQRAERDFAAEQGHMRKGELDRISEGLGCPEHQQREAIENARKHGVRLEFRGDEMVFSSRRHRRDVLRYYEVHDVNAGYGD